MAKLLWILAIVLLVVWLLRPRRSSRPQTGPPQRPVSPDVEDMVRCARCGLHLPRNDALRNGDAFFCSEAHRIEHAAERTPHA